MNETSLRLTEPGKSPDLQQIEAWIGKRAFGFWKRITSMIDHNYPGVFAPEWLYVGKKHGWSLRYKKSRSFCTLVPEKRRLMILIVFGAKERAKVETLKQELSGTTRKAYDEATTYHDGKWLLLAVDRKEVIQDIERLLTAKRKPRLQA